MKNFSRFLCVLFMLFAFSSVGLCETRLRMSTTTSTENSGLLKILLPPFEKENNLKVDVISVGTGKALKLGENGDVDVVLVHSRPAEDKFVSEGFGVDRRDVMYNDFIIIGPKNDPAKIKDLKSATEAFKKIAEAKALFISRGDDSGTNMKEKAIWKADGITPKGPWYIEAGKGMGAVLQMANEKNAYTLSDRGTFISYENKTDLVILVQGDKSLFNPYGVIAVNPEKRPNVQYALAKKFIDFITGPEGQKIIADYKLNGKQLFFPDAKK
ncbi:MAG: substrate-binding domain-containing protein [Syntrophaceae bacterium]|nr:substrate-binding domain-containing protein [Syntrophaceae bacterium]